MKSNLTIAMLYLLIYSGYTLILESDCQCANQNPNISFFLQKWEKQSISRFNLSSFADSWLGEQIYLRYLHFCFQHALFVQIWSRFVGISRRISRISLFYLGRLFNYFLIFCFPIRVVCRNPTSQSPIKTSLLS